MARKRGRHMPGQCAVGPEGGHRSEDESREKRAVRFADDIYRQPRNPYSWMYTMFEKRARNPYSWMNTDA
ncbi:unnamed protein product [Heligmosomoides polygyrus]|uniref:Uncharacterized protein n=1 Tax=Heligmosomoides polygyrus TaxID=6339 RepID=A0A183GTK8_HELPZ|nr:unnamed protein product [Heligmosomoides polygyrus]